MNEYMYEKNFDFKAFIGGSLIIAIVLGFAVYGVVSLIK